jgi:uncharacterized Zn-binding protein involved in type VI secretion
MPALARIGDSFSTGHGCTGTSTLTSPSPNVFANGKGVERKGDPSVSHTINTGRWCATHVATISGGSSTVFINGIPCARVGDPIDSGSIISGSDSVFVGG